MAYTAASQLPQLNIFQWSLPAAPNPRLSAPIVAADTTLTFTHPPKDKDGTVITGHFLMNVKNEAGYTEQVYIPSGTLAYDAQSANFTVGSVLTGGTSNALAVITADTDSGTTGTLTLAVISGTFQNNETITDEAGGSATVDGTITNSMSADGLTASNAVRGVRLEGLDFFTSDSTLAADHGQDSPVGCSVSPVNFQLMVGAMQGTVASGGASWGVGRNVDEDITVFAKNGDANPPFWHYDSATNAWNFSNDGVSSTPFGTGAGVTGGDGITVTAGDIDVDLATDPALEFTSNQIRVKVKASSGITRDSDGISVNESDFTTVLFTPGAGVTDQVLAYDSGEASDNKWIYVNKKLNVTTTEVTVANTVTETDLINFTCPANLLGTNNAIRVRLFIRDFDFSTGETCQFKLYYGTGAVTISPMGDTGSAGSDTNFVGYIEGVIMGKGATGSQEAQMTAEFKKQQLDMKAGSTESYLGYVTGSPSIDSTATQTIKVTAQWNNADPSATITMHHAIVELITAP